MDPEMEILLMILEIIGAAALFAINIIYVRKRKKLLSFEKMSHDVGEVRNLKDLLSNIERR